MPDAREQREPLVRVEDHIGLVRAVVYKYFRKGKIEDSDLYSVGCLALVDAARTFDPSKSKFCTWATRLVNQRVLDEIRRARKGMEQSSPESLESMPAADRGDPVHLVHFMVDGSDSDSDSESESKSVLRKYYLEEKSLSEIGREFGITKEGVRKRLKSALSVVRSKNRNLLENAL